MKSLPWGLFLLIAIAQPACQSDSGTPGVTCKLGGKVYKPGDTFLDEQGCNTCRCSDDGTVGCTELACIDGGRLRDGAAGDGGGDLVMCQAGGNSSFPSFDKSCATPADCSIALHQINCCGSQKAIGISNGDKARFDKDEGLCRSMYPACGCPTQPTVAEDNRSATDTDSIKVDCRQNACSTFVP